MSSGQRREVFNTLEELISGDLMRLQAFAGAHVAKALRALFMSPSSSATSGGAETLVVDSPPAGPLRAVIFAGLRAAPDNDGTDMFVTAGTVLVAAPDSPQNPDDCPVKLVHDEGVQVAAQLSLTPGDAVLFRCDVVEFSVAAEVAEELDNRNVWDDGTSQYLPTTVPKVATTVLTWRIRTGTPGAGFPGVAPGWCPVCVAVVLPNAVTWSGTALWDVRPLAGDLSDPTGESQVYPRRHRVSGRLTYDIVPASPYISIVAEVEDQVGHVLGGELLLQQNAPSSTEPGHVKINQELWYLWALEPFGLPRWCKYATGSPRLPGKFRGIPVVTSKGVSTAGSAAQVRPDGDVALPTLLGLGGATSDGALILAGLYDSTPAATPMALEGRCTRLGAAKTVGFPGATFSETATLTSGTHHPGNACRVLLRSTFNASASAAPERLGILGRTITHYGPVATGGSPGNAIGAEVWQGGVVIPDVSEQFVDVWETWMPLASAPEIAGPVDRDVRYQLVANGNFTVAVTSCDLVVVGWELLP